jgi:hypothetical protein
LFWGNHYLSIRLSVCLSVCWRENRNSIPYSFDNWVHYLCGIVCTSSQRGWTSRIPHMHIQTFSSQTCVCARVYGDFSVFICLANFVWAWFYNRKFVPGA